MIRQLRSTAMEDFKRTSISKAIPHQKLEHYALPLLIFTLPYEGVPKCFDRNIETHKMRKERNLDLSIDYLLEMLLEYPRLL